jgi:hypothetical protein
VLIGLFCQSETPVDEQIVECDIAGFTTYGVTIAHTVEPAVLNEDVIHVGVFVETDDLYTVLGFLAGDILHIDVAYRGVETSTAYLVVLIVEVDLEYTLLADTHFDVAHVDILNDTATAGVGLDT